MKHYKATIWFSLEDDDKDARDFMEDVLIVGNIFEESAFSLAVEEDKAV